MEHLTALSNFLVHDGAFYSPFRFPATIANSLQQLLGKAARICPSASVWISQVSVCFWRQAGSIGGWRKEIKIQLLADRKKKNLKPQITKKKNPVRKKESNKSVEDGCLELFSLMHARFLLSSLPPRPLPLPSPYQMLSAKLLKHPLPFWPFNSSWT